MKNIRLPLVLAVLLLIQCSQKRVESTSESDALKAIPASAQVVVGADQLDVLIPKLAGKNVALVVNHTSLVGDTHIADTLMASGITIKKVFAPEHGFRGAAADGEKIADGTDARTGLPIVSLYGSNRKPTPEQLADVDIVVFDIQDVGTRFYTYISTMHYVMEACAGQEKKMIILDRPNPNGNYIDGPMRVPALKSFVGMHPIPIVHGLTVGELSGMINGEGWLEKGVKCDVEVIPVKNWKHADFYSLPVKPSPNLPNDQAVKLYPSLCLFEGTVISVGRGTQTPFLIIGNPEFKDLPFSFTPEPIPGMSNTPPQQGKVCYGLDLRDVEVQPRIDLGYLLDFYQRYPDKEKFFTGSFDRLAGTPELKEQIKKGLTEEQIRASWQEGLEAYGKMRTKYLLYP
ncbi:MAG: DUF1343 domain-containing protein [Bacteroidota bacterium]|nr:DUF1343 domain-containing protein [Bacteroidota bacterium]